MQLARKENVEDSEAGSKENSNKKGGSSCTIVFYSTVFNFTISDMQDLNYKEGNVSNPKEKPKVRACECSRVGLVRKIKYLAHSRLCLWPRPGFSDQTSLPSLVDIQI